MEWKSVICSMKRRRGVEGLMQQSFPFPFNSRPRRLKLASPFFPAPNPLPLLTPATQATVHWRTTNFTLRRHLTNHCSQYAFVLIRITQIFRKVHACYTCLCWQSGIVRGRLNPTKNLNLMIVRNTKQVKGDVIWWSATSRNHPFIADTSCKGI